MAVFASGNEGLALESMKPYEGYFFVRAGQDALPRADLTVALRNYVNGEILSSQSFTLNNLTSAYQQVDEPHVQAVKGGVVLVLTAHFCGTL